MIEARRMSPDRRRRNGWEVQENDFGWPMVRHRRPGHEATAYVFAQGEAMVAKCSACGARHRLDPSDWLL